MDRIVFHWGKILGTHEKEFFRKQERSKQAWQIMVVDYE